MEKKLYLAYGSNMNLAQMARRCPTAEAVGTARLEGYRLVFRGGYGAVANVEPHGGGSVPVLLWRIAPADEAALDVYEGFPTLYRKETVTVDYGKKTVEAMVYIMNEGKPLGVPSRYYFDVIRQGYNDWGIDTEPLEQALVDSMGGMDSNDGMQTFVKV